MILITLGDDRVLIYLFLCQVEWGSEKECFQTFAQECSEFHSFRADVFEAPTNEDKDPADPSTEPARAPGVPPWRWTVEHVLFPAFRCGLVPPSRFADDGTLLQVADLHDLYKVFERC